MAGVSGCCERIALNLIAYHDSAAAADERRETLSNRAFSYLKSAAAASEGLQHQRLPSMATPPREMLVDMHLTSWAAAGDHEAIAALVPDYKVTPTGQSYAAQQSLLRPPLSYALPALVRLAAASGAVGTLTALRTAGKLFFEARRCTHTSPLTPLNPPTHDCRCRGLGEGSAGPCDARDSCEYRRAVDAERFHAPCALTDGAARPTTNTTVPPLRYLSSSAAPTAAAAPTTAASAAAKALVANNGHPSLLTMQLQLLDLGVPPVDENGNELQVSGSVGASSYGGSSGSAFNRLGGGASGSGSYSYKRLGATGPLAPSSPSSTARSAAPQPASAIRWVVATWTASSTI